VSVPAAIATVYGGRVTDLATKLRIVDGRGVRLMHAPDRHVPMLGHVEQSSETAAVVLLYSRNREQLGRDAPAAIDAVEAAGVLWVCYPKRSAKTPSDLSREVVRDGMAALGWHPVSQVSIDDTWSALRFKPDP
jgi:hypothetical protein